MKRKILDRVNYSSYRKPRVLFDPDTFDIQHARKLIAAANGY